MELNYEIAKDLYDIQSVQIKVDGYFTWTSGIKSPIYCDNRLTMSYPVVRQKIRRAFIQKIAAMKKKPDVIAGCATAGIPHAAWLAEELNLPMVYVRSSAKAHGKGNQIEGTFKKGQKILVIEDLISTGGSSINAAKALRAEGGEVIGVLAIFTYGLEKSITQFRDAEIAFDTITSFADLLDVLMEDGQIKESDRLKLLAWREHV